VHPGRVSRLVIGVVVAGVLMLLSLASYQAALDARYAAENDGRDVAAYPRYTARATATVLDVSPDARAGLVKTVARFTPGRGEPVTTRVTWSEGFGRPEVGDEFEVAYDPERPAQAAYGSEVLSLAQEAGGLDRITAGTAGLPGFGPALVVDLLALGVLLATIPWTFGLPGRARRQQVSQPDGRPSPR
jgi:hypothetical protein